MTGPELVGALAEAFRQAIPQPMEPAALDPGRFTEVTPQTRTAKEVGELDCIRLSESRVRELAHDGAFPGAYKRGSTWFIPYEGVLLYLRSLQRETAEAHGFEPYVCHPDNEVGSEPGRHAAKASPDTERPTAAPHPEVEDDWDPDAEPDWNAWKEEYDE